VKEISKLQDEYILIDLYWAKSAKQRSLNQALFMLANRNNQYSFEASMIGSYFSIPL